jgi:predicted RNase H-like HicB family nuclease
MGSMIPELLTYLKVLWFYFFAHITAIIEKSTDGWYIGQIEEYPEVLSRGKTIDELKDNLVSALSEAMQIQRQTLD